MIRKYCMNNCGRLAPKDSSECRKCRRKRLHAGLKHIKKMAKQK